MNKLILSLALTLCSASSAAEILNKGTKSVTMCYLPTQSNVSYSEVIELPTDSPLEVISYGSNPLQFAELWLPKGAEGSKAPLVIFVHGGCWLNQYDIKHTHAFSSALAQAGYAVWSVEYRRTGDKGGGWPGSFEDIEAAVKFASSLQRDSVDTDKLILSGHSAGGHLALLAGARNKNIHGIVGLAAITDIEQYAKGENSCQTATPKFMGGPPNQKPQQYLAANPSKQSRHPNTVLIHGSSDQIVPLQQAKQFSAKPRVIADAGHFDPIHPGTLAFKALLKELAQLTR